MTQSTFDPVAGTSSAGTRANGGGTPLLALDGSASETGAGRDRLHRFAGMLHRAIDKVEQQVGGGGQGVMSAQAGYGEQARQYGDTARERINAKPLQAVGIAWVAGVIFSKLFLRAPKVKVVPQVRVVEVPVRTPVSTPVRDAARSTARTANRWMDSAAWRLQGLAGAGQETAWKTRASANRGLAEGKATASTLAATASTLPLQVQLAGQRLLAWSQEYGARARLGMQAHPLASVAALFGAGALLATPWLMRHRTSSPDTAYVKVDEKGNGVAWQHEAPDVKTSAVGLMSSRPIASAALLFAVGGIVTTMLRRR